MNKDNLIYWTTTGIIGGMMIFAGIFYLVSPEVADNFRHLGFPGYFRIELAIAKMLGGVVLLVPSIPYKVKGWAYAGFAIVFVSASFAHLNSGDGVVPTISPLVFLGMLIVSYRYLNIRSTVRVTA